MIGLVLREKYTCYPWGTSVTALHTYLAMQIMQTKSANVEKGIGLLTKACMQSLTQYWWFKTNNHCFKVHNIQLLLRTTNSKSWPFLIGTHACPTFRSTVQYICFLAKQVQKPTTHFSVVSAMGMLCGLQNGMGEMHRLLVFKEAQWRFTGRIGCE